MAAPVRFVQVDAFTDQPFRGNPAAVCVLDAARPDDWYQAVAAEMNLSETAFVVAGADREWSLRWFTPTVEVDLCGHATLASAHVLWSTGAADGPLRFATRSGQLRAAQEGTDIRLDFPSRPPVARPPVDGLLPALGCPVDSISWVGAAGPIWLVEVDSPAGVATLTPDFGALRRCPGVEVVIVTAAGGHDADVVCRVFGPGVGIDEDPVTGSAHCLLGPYWTPRLGDRRLRSHQISARGGWVGVQMDRWPDGSGDRVALFGQAVTVAEGSILH